MIPAAFNFEMLSTFDQWLHLRYKPKRKYFRGLRPCPAFELFDWIIWNPHSNGLTRTSIRRPEKILCLPSDESLDILLRKISRIKDATIVFAGKDIHLSQVLDRIELILPYTRQVFFEAKDVEHSKIKSFSMGFNAFYLRKSGHEQIREVCQFADQNFDSKQGVLAAWGKQWPKLDQRIPDRQNATRFVEQCGWIDRQSIPFDQYWMVLAKHRFLLAPEGNGVQAPKLAEAWMVKTIPIVTDNPCFRDLKEMGYPLMILDNWDELTEAYLEKHQNDFDDVDWERVRTMLSLDWFGQLLDGNLIWI